MRHGGDDLTPLVVSAFPNAKALPLWAGEALGIFARHGIALTIDLTPGSDAQREKLLDGRIHIAQAAVDNALQLIVEGHDVIIAMGGESGMNDFIVQAEITSFADLRGRTLVVDAPNTAYALLARKILAGAGLEAGADYQIKPIGNASMRLQAMFDDPKNAGGVMNPPFSSQAKLRGMKSLGRLTDLTGPYQAGGAFLLRAFAIENAPVLENYIKAYVTSLRWVLDPANRAAGIDLLLHKLKLTRDVASAAHGQIIEPGFGFQPDAKLDLAGVRNMLATRAQTQGHDPRLEDTTAFIDETAYRKALATLEDAPLG
jgi:ABC-type nitrate/sulfonate/bicarbonate transport system substrate-binding protein